MKLVIDTHALVWYASAQDRRLSKRARRAFEEAEDGRAILHVPVVVLFEIFLLEERGRIRVSHRELEEQLSIRSGFVLEPLTPADIREAQGARSISDPFDRLIAGTALRLGLPLLTNDGAISASKAVKVYW